MKMVKSLLLGSAAGVVAVAGAQAADLPVKAKPVEYVKICSLYGDGFYYIPGTDICIRVGGYVIADYFWNGQGNGANQPIFTGARRCVRPHHLALGHQDASQRADGYPYADRVRHVADVHEHPLQQRQREPTRSTRARVHPVRGLHVRPHGVILRRPGRLGPMPTPIRCTQQTFASNTGAERRQSDLLYLGPG